MNASNINNGNIVDQISGPLRKGTHRVTWGLRTSKATTVNVASGSANRQRWGRSRGIMTNVNPGTYSVTLHKRVGGDLTKLSDPVSITVERIRENILKNPKHRFNLFGLYHFIKIRKVKLIT